MKNNIRATVLSSSIFLAATGATTTQVLISSSYSEVIAIAAMLSLVTSVVFIAFLIAYGTN